jgi:hypothetical protein
LLLHDLFFVAGLSQALPSGRVELAAGAAELTCQDVSCRLTVASSLTAAAESALLYAPDVSQQASGTVAEMEGLAVANAQDPTAESGQA